MSISSSKSPFPLIRGLYSNIGGSLSLYTTTKPISSAFIRSRAVSTAFYTSGINHQSTPWHKHTKIAKVIASGVLPNRIFYSPMLKKRLFYSRKTNDYLHNFSRLFGELKTQEKRIEADIKPRLNKIELELKGLSKNLRSEIGKKEHENLIETDIKPRLDKIEEALKDLPKNLKSEIRKKEHENLKEFSGKAWAYIKDMTLFDWAKKVGAPITAFAIYFFRAQISDHLKKIFKKEADHIDITAENLLRLKDAFKFQEVSIKKVAIIGIAGSGRTHLAKQYVEHYEQSMRGQPDSIRTVFLGDGRDFGTFVQLYTKFAEDLGVKVPLEASQEVIIEEVNKKLAERPHWLFVIDNVESYIYEKLQAYFPNAPKGKILLVAQENLKGVISFDINENIACQDEALKIFNLNLGEDHWAFQLANNSKRELIRQLFYLPLAIKQAAIHLKEEKREDDKQVDSFSSSIASYIATLKNIAKEENEDSMQVLDADRILKAIVSLCIEKCIIKKRDCEIIFSILTFLNPVFIEESLLKNWFISKGGKPELFAPILDLLEKSSLITLEEQNKWEIHPYLRKVLIRKVNKKEKKSKVLFKEFVFFLTKNYGLDMRFANEYNSNKALVNLLEPLLKHAEKLGVKEELKLYFVYLYNVLGNYHLQSNNLFEAQKAFKESLKLAAIEPEKQTAENLYQCMSDLNVLRNYNFQLRDNVNIWQTFKKNLNLARIRPIDQTSIALVSLIKKLENIEKKNELSKKDVLALCAQSIHYLGKIYFQTGDLNQAKHYFEKALYLHKKVITYPALHGNPNPFDVIIFQRQGIGWALLEGNKEALKEAKNLYLKLFDEKKFIREGQKIDESNEWYCNLQLGRVYLKLARVASKELEKKGYYQKAKERLERDTMKNSACIQGAIHIKKGRHSLVLGELYLDEGCPFRDLEIAESYFERALYLSKTDLLICAESKHCLAKLYVENNLADQALVAINEALRLYNKLGGIARILPREAMEAEQLKNALLRGAFRNTDKEDKRLELLMV